VKRLVFVLAVAAVILSTGASPARATTECKGLTVCVPVAGPWVVLPRQQGPQRQSVEYQLSCPSGYVVAGLDAELSDRAIDVGFLGVLGSPVNPGITTSRAVVFVGRYAGALARTVSFRPHIGCIPTRGGGGRVPTSVARVYPPGQPLVRRVSNMRVRPGRTLAVQSCAHGERLVAAAHAVGFYTSAPPGARLTGSVSATRTVRGGKVVVTVRAGARVSGARTVVQVSALCAGGE
jgi:hypothetical protein